MSDQSHSNEDQKSSEESMTPDFIGPTLADEERLAGQEGGDPNIVGGVNQDELKDLKNRENNQDGYDYGGKSSGDNSGSGSGGDSGNSKNALDDLRGRVGDDKDALNFGDTSNKDRQNNASGRGQIGYSPGGKKGGRFRTLLKKRRTMVLTSATFATFTGLGIASILSLTGLKLNLAFGELDQASFASYNSLFDRRSQAWFDAYVKIRLTEIDGGTKGDSLYFRSDKVDNGRKKRISNWYKTIRSSNFEADLFEKHGIAFTSVVDPVDGKIRPAAITTRKGVINFEPKDFIKDSSIASLKDKDLGKFKDIDADAFNKMTNGEFDATFESKKFDNDKEARKFIASILDSDFADEGFIRRRFLRKSIQNRTGIRDWRLFEGTRDKISNQKNKLRIKLLNKVIPATDTGNLIACLLTVGPCPKTTNIADIDNHNTGNPTGDAKEDPTENSDENREYYDKDGDVITDPDEIKKARADSSLGKSSTKIDAAVKDLKYINADGKVAKNLTKVLGSKIINKLGIGSSIVGLVDMISTLHHLIVNNTIVKVLTNMALAYSIASWTNSAIGTEQIISGVDVDRTEVSAHTASYEGHENSEAYETVVNGNSALAMTNPGGVHAIVITDAVSDHACENDPSGLGSSPIDGSDQRFYHMCRDLQLGDGGKNTGKNEAYENSPTGRITGVFAAIDGNRIYSIIASPFKLFDFLLGEAVSAILVPMLSAAGVNPEDVTVWLMGHIGKYFGLIPKILGDEPGGYRFNYETNGAIGAAQDGLSAAGGRRVTPAITESNNRTIAAYKQKVQDEASWQDRYTNKNNPNSLVASLILTAPSGADIGEPINAFASIFSKAKNVVFNIFGASLFAQSASDCQVDGGECVTKVDPSTQAVLQKLSGLDHFYGFSKGRVDADPIGMPIFDVVENDKIVEFGCTNARDILNEKGSRILSDLKLTDAQVSDSDIFRSLIHKELTEKTSVDSDFDLTLGQIENICLMDSQIVTGMSCQHSPSDSCGLSGSSTRSEAESKIGELVTGESAELAQKLLDSPNVAFNFDGPKNSITSIANGEAAKITCDNGSEEGKTETTMNNTLLSTLVTISEEYKLSINFLADGCHTTGSSHYSGRAVDLHPNKDIEEIMKYIYNNRVEINADELFYNKDLDHTLNDGEHYGKTVDGHSTHAHFSVGT